VPVTLDEVSPVPTGSITVPEGPWEPLPVPHHAGRSATEGEEKA